MAWIVLIVSGILETVWAIALERSNAFSRPVPTTVFVVALVSATLVPLGAIAMLAMLALKLPLTLLGTETYDSGVVLLRYEPERA